MKTRKSTQLIFVAVMHLYMKEIGQCLEAEGIRPGQGILLMCLTGNDGASQGELAKALGIKPPSITVMMRKLEAQGYITRQADQCDQRKMRIYITEKGKETAAKTQKALTAMEEKMSCHMTEKDKAVFRRLLLQVVENLSSDMEIPAFPLLTGKC